MPEAPVGFDDLPASDLVVDRTYQGGVRGTSADDPLQRLLPVGNQGGFRFAGSPTRRTVKLCVLYTSGAEADWPDRLDVTTGDFAYFGDNRTPGNQLLSTGRRGNLLLEDSFASSHGDAADRARVPPYLLFQKGSVRRDVIFRGLLAPGSSRLSPEEELVAVWRTTAGSRFQNYRAHFTVLDVPVVPRGWINEILAGDPLGAVCPRPWREWVSSRSYTPLLAPKTVIVRPRHEQLPHSVNGRAILQALRSHFQFDPHRFESFAADLWLMSDPRVVSIDVTRPSRDGGRDAIGEYVIGPDSDPITIDFALEAKCYGESNSVGVREVSRLISRIRARQFGVLVTTSFVADQAYHELREDAHPIVIISGADIVDILSRAGIRTAAEVIRYLHINHPDTTAPRIDLNVLSTPEDSGLEVGGLEIPSAPATTREGAPAGRSPAD